MAFILVCATLFIGYISVTSAARAQATVTVLTPSGAPADVVGEGDDYFTRVLGDPRDMNEHTDLMWQEYGIANISLSGGIWSGAAVNPSSGLIWALYPGHAYGGAAQIGKIGWNVPVQASKYRQLSFRLNAPAGSPVQTLAGYSTVSHTFGTLGIVGSYVQGWQVYTATMSWSDPVYGLFHNFGAAGLYQIDWVRLTDSTTSPVYTITFTVGSTQPGDVVDLTCYTSSVVSNENFCGRIATGIPTDLPGTYSYLWRTAYLAPGGYTVRAEVKRGGVTQASDLSDGALTIQPAPIVRIDAPSMTSGPDYATVELGNPWNMDDQTDLKLIGGGWTIHDLQECAPGAALPAPCFSNGELYATTGRLDPDVPAGFSDPFVYLNVDPQAPIDTSKYKYLTFRYKIDRTPYWEHSGSRLGDNPPGSGNYPAAWVIRMVFFTDPLPDLNSSNQLNDIIVFDDWNTYPMDLSQGQQRGYWEPDAGIPQTGGYWTGLKTWVRFDFLEGVDPWTVHLDEVKLTGDDTADASYTVRWSLRGSGRPTSINFYAHPNPASCGSGSVIFTWPPTPISPPPITGMNLIYLPIVQRDPLSGSFSWNTSGVAPGAYYVCAVAQDGNNVSRWVSETPVIISH